jgi:alpha-1,2-mannosyltransferase
VNTWPPLFSLFCTIPALLARPTPHLARGLWIVLNYFLVGLALQMTVRLVYGRTISLSGEGIALSMVDAAVLVPLLLCARFVVSNFDHLQANVLIFALVLGALVLHCANRDLLSGCCLGLAVALKIMPALFVPYFLFRGRYRVALAATVVGVALSVSPCLVYGWDRYVDYIFSWLHVLKAGWSVGKMNQSAFAMLDRFLGHGIAVWQSGPTNGLFRSFCQWVRGYFSLES